MYAYVRAWWLRGRLCVFVSVSVTLDLNQPLAGASGTRSGRGGGGRLGRRSLARAVGPAPLRISSFCGSNRWCNAISRRLPMHRTLPTDSSAVRDAPLLGVLSVCDWPMVAISRVCSQTSRVQFYSADLCLFFRLREGNELRRLLHLMSCASFLWGPRQTDGHGCGENKKNGGRCKKREADRSRCSADGCGHRLGINWRQAIHRLV